MNFKKMAIWFVAPVAMIIIWGLAVYLPITSGSSKKQGMIASILKERKDIEMNIVSISQQMQVQDNLKKTYDNFLKQTPTVDKTSGFMRDLVRDARLRGMAVDSLSGHYEGIDSARKSVVNPVFELSIRGSFLDMGKFLENMSEKSSFKVIRNARIAYDETDNATLTGKFMVEFKALQGKPGEGK